MKTLPNISLDSAFYATLYLFLLLFLCYPSHFFITVCSKVVLNLAKAFSVNSGSNTVEGVCNHFPSLKCRYENSRYSSPVDSGMFQLTSVTAGQVKLISKIQIFNPSI